MITFKVPRPEGRKPRRKTIRGDSRLDQVLTDWSPAFERLENRCVLSAVATFGTDAVSLPVDPTVQLMGTITNARVDSLYRVTLDAGGVLEVTVHAQAIKTLLSLKSETGGVLIQGESSSPTDPDDRIAQHLPSGTYYLAVSGLTGAGTFEISTTFTQASAPDTTLDEGLGAYNLTAADLYGDGKSDLILPDYYNNRILINNGVGDGTFQPPVSVPVGIGPIDVIAASLSGDGLVDLVVVDQLSNDLTILKGDGLGNFQVSQVLKTCNRPVNVVAGNFSDDNELDLAVADGASDCVQIFHNVGDGTFVASTTLTSIGDPTSIALVKFKGESRPDLAVSSGASGSVVLFQGTGNDNFKPLPYQLQVGAGCSDVIAANLDGSNWPDLIAVSPDSGVITVFRFDGWSFRPVSTWKAGNDPEQVVAADLNGDGQVDLASVEYSSNQVSIFVNDGNDRFSPSTSYSTGAGPSGLVSADFNGDGHADLATTNLIGLSISVILNNGDSTFRTPPRMPPQSGPQDVLTADLTGNGILDLVVPESGTDQVSVLLGRGDGTFRDPIQISVGSAPEDVAIGDFNGDGIPDLAVSEYNSNSITILQGKGDGTFTEIGTLSAGDGPDFIETADLDRDGHLDLVVANYLSNNISILYGLGGGKFSSPVFLPVGVGPSGVAISDLNGDGLADITVSDSGSDDVDVLLSKGSRSFQTAISNPTQSQPWYVRAGDFNGDGHPDLVVTDGLSSPSVVSLLLGVGNGTFLPHEDFGTGNTPYALAIGDFAGDGHLDIVSGNDGTNDLTVLSGDGHGGFSSSSTLPAGLDPYGLAVGDFNGDGHLDIVAANYESSSLTVYLGRGNGTFQDPETISLDASDDSTITADLQGNDVTDVIVADPQLGSVTVSASQGDGTVQLLSTIAVGGSPSGLVAGDFNGDGRLDLAVTDSQSNQVLILLGLGDGSFQSPIRYSVGMDPQSPVIGDFDHDGHVDLAVADTGSDQVSILMGRGDGTFLPQHLYPVGKEPTALVVGFAHGFDNLDIGVADRSGHALTELVGLTGGNFLVETVDLPGINPAAFGVGDFNGDGQADLAIDDASKGYVYIALDLATNPNVPLIPIEVGPGKVFVESTDLYHQGASDLILANANTGVVTILSGWTGSSFSVRYSFPVSVTIAGLSITDLNKDGLPDILITQAGTGAIETYLSAGKGVFSQPETNLPVTSPAPIVFAHAYGSPSVIVNVTSNGDVLARVERVGTSVDFATPVNETSGTGFSLRAFALVQTGGIPEEAGLDAYKSLIYLSPLNNSDLNKISFLFLPSVGNYTRMISGDLFGTGRDDLVVINRTLDEILIFQQSSSGVFIPYGPPIPVGFGPTDVTLAQLNPGGLPDLVVSNGASSDLTIIARNSHGGFYNSATLPAGLAASSTVLEPDGLKRTSADETVGVVAGSLDSSGLDDVVALDRGTDQIAILRGLPDGGLSAPSLANIYPTGTAPIQVLLAPLGRNGFLDIAVLNEGTHDISIFLNDGHGGFVALPRIDAGNDPLSMCISDITDDGKLDLIVSNSEGDILILAGNGDGTFQPYQRADGAVNLAVGNLTGNGQNDFVLTNTAQDLLTVQTSSATGSFIQGRGNGLLAPGPVAIADMNDDGIPDLIVTNTGGNDVFVYLGLGHGQYASPQQFYTGTEPVGLTVANLIGNGLPDLVVANAGSNDVNILLGTIEPDGTWTMIPGPRLKAGERPVSTTVADVFDDGMEDIVVVNQDSNDVTLLRGLGSGFFDDKNPLTLATGLSPTKAFVGHFSRTIGPGLVVLDSQSNAMTYYAGIDSSALTIPSGGVDPVAGVMGDFNGDGFSDLAVANNGDSRITLFYGGVYGLSLVQTIELGASAHPTDLVVSTSKQGNVQFYVGDEGQDHPIPIYFTSISTVVSTEPISTSGGLINADNLGRDSGGSFSTSGESDTELFVTTANLNAFQNQESAATSAQPGESAVAVSQGTTAVMALAQATQSLFTPSSRTLGWLIDNLIQLAPGQTAEILPLGKDEMAAVAVLLSGSSMSHAFEEVLRPSLPVFDEEESPHVTVSFLGRTRTPPLSELNRFLASLGVSSFNLSDEVAIRPVPVAEFGSDWVWHRRMTDRSAFTASFDDGPDANHSTRSADPGVEVSVSPVFSEAIEVESLDGQESPLWKRIAILLTSVVVMTIASMVANRSAWRKNRPVHGRRSEPSCRLSMPDRSMEKTVATLAGSKFRQVQDLPPWLQGPMSPKFLRTSTDRKFMTTFFRKRARGGRPDSSPGSGSGLMSSRSS